MVSAERAASTTDGPLPQRPPSSPAETVPSRRPGLDVVDRRRAAAQSRRRQATVLRALGALLVVGSLAATAVAHAVVASNQQQLDILQSQLTQTLIAQQGLQVARAELESPGESCTSRKASLEWSYPVRYPICRRSIRGLRSPSPKPRPPKPP